MRLILADADCAEAVVDVDVRVSSDVGSGERRERVISSARSQAFVGAGHRDVHRRKNRQDRKPAGLGPDPQLRADLQVADSSGRRRSGSLREQSVGADSRLQPLCQADSRRHRSARGMFSSGRVRVEARIASDGLLMREARGTTARGIGNAQLGVKVRLLGSVEEPFFSVMPAVNLGLASRDKGLGSGESDATITLLAGHALGYGFHGEANYGIGSIGDPAGRFPQHLVTGAIVHQSTSRLQSYVEAAWWSRQERDRAAVSFVDYGVIFSLMPRVLIDAGAFTGVTAATPDYGLFTGLSFAVGPDRARSAARRFGF